jgi:hypothetical protein
MEYVMSYGVLNVMGLHGLLQGQLYLLLFLSYLHHILSDVIALIIFGEVYRYKVHPYVIFSISLLFTSPRYKDSPQHLLQSMFLTNIF